MKLILSLLILVSFQLCGQSNMKPFIQAGYFQTFSHNLYVNELELGVGVQFNDYISAQINFRGLQDRLPQDPPRSFRVASLSITPSYRIFGKKHRFSPVIAYDAGVEIANNSKDRFIKYYVYHPYYKEPYNQYNKGLYFGKAKLLLNIQLKDFDILVGATYNTYFFKFNRLTPQGTQNYIGTDNKYKIDGTFVDGQFGFGFETSVKYTFPMKKQQAKKVVE